MEITGKGLTASLALRNKTSNKKQKERFSMTEITKQDFRFLFNKFENIPYIGYKSKQVHT